MTAHAPASRVVLAAALAIVCAAPLRAGDAREEAQKLIRKLQKDKNADARSMAAERLGDMGAVEAVPALAAALKDKDSAVRANAAGALLKIGEGAKDAMPALQDALFDSDSTTVWNAAGALGNMGVVTTDLMPAYRRLLLDPDCDMKVSAALAISEYASPDEMLPVALACRKAQVGDYETAGNARKLMAIVAKDKTAVPLLAERLRGDPDRDVREWAARSLGEIGPPAKDAIPALEGALADVEDAVRAEAGKALKKVDPRRR